jgi:hypothetical protein
LAIISSKHCSMRRPSGVLPRSLEQVACRTTDNREVDDAPMAYEDDARALTYIFDCETLQTMFAMQRLFSEHPGDLVAAEG